MPLRAVALLLLVGGIGTAAVIQDVDGRATITASNIAAARSGPAVQVSTNDNPSLKLRPKNPEDAMSMARHLEFHPADAEAWRLLGEYHFHRSEFGAAATNFSKGLQLVPGDSRCANNLAASLVMLGQVDEARKMLESRVSLFPKNYSMRFNLACIAARQNRKNDAIRQLSELEQMHWPALSLQLADPDLDSLRNDAAFIAIQKRVQHLPAGVRFYETVK